MKRLFSNKSGFTLAEIIIAIAIFSIMMAMIMQMLQLSIAQRNANMKFAKDLAQQQDDLVVNGKDTSSLPEDTTFDGKVKLSFKKDPTDSSETPLDIAMDYVVKAADPDATDINNGINYFVGDFDYSADGVGGSGGSGNGKGGQISQYDTGITGTKGLKDINISVEKNPTLPDDVTLGAGQVAYEITVKASSADMQNDDKRYSQMMLYFYSSTDFESQKVEKIEKVKEDGKEVEKVDTYYKKVYKQANLINVIPDDSNVYDASKSSSNAVRIGLPINGGDNNNGFRSSNATKFIVIFKGDPGITAASFGANGSGGTYNASSVYSIEKNKTTGKYESVNKPGKSHVNIYGSYPYEVSDKPIK